jgi:regulation of enolase protein 1 (concanavalin A-like superfamily)
MIKKNFVGLIAIMLVIICGGLSATTANASYPILKLDIGRGHTSAEVQAGFTAFSVSDSGTVVDGIKIEVATTIAGEAIQQRWRGGPTGIPYEQLYRDFWFTVNGGLRITLSGLNPNETYEITLYSWDQSSAERHVADWIANGDYCLTTDFTGGTSVAAEDSYAFSGDATADGTGQIILEATPNPLTSYPGPPGQYFCFLNAVVVSSLTPLTTARHPVPANGATVLTTAVELQWEPGMLRTSSNIYLGEDRDQVSNATTNDTNIFRGSTTNTSFTVGSAESPYPDGLVPNTTYYWRIDEVNDLHPEKLWKGEVWSFTVASLSATQPQPINGSLFVDPNVVLTWTVGAGAVRHHVYFGSSLSDVQAGTGGTDKGTVTDPCYPTGMLELDTTYYWRVDEIDATTTHAGDVWSFTTTLPGLGTVTMDFWEDVAGDFQLPNLLNDPRYPDSPTRSEALTEFGTVDGVGNNYGAQIYGWLYCPVTGEYTFWLSSAGQGELWLSTDDDPVNIVLLASEANWGTYNSFSIKSVPISLMAGQKYYIMARWKDFASWDHCQVAWKGAGIRDQEIIQGSYLSPYEPLSAYGPTPSNGRTNINQTPILKWNSGKFAASHNIYLGSDPNNLNLLATTPAGQEIYGPLSPPLDVNMTYYWRVDEVNNLSPDSPWVGTVWSFTTAPYLVVDDFEYYDDVDNRIYNTWGDYYVNNTGMTVGHLDPPFAERAVVHFGSQAMYMRYDNDGTVNEGTSYEQSGTLFYSEAEREWADAQNWTAQGATSLLLWFRGIPASVGSFTEGPPITMTAGGADIWDTADQFHFAYKQLSGLGSITAKVVSVTDSDPWAKAGVMIRESLAPGAVNVAMVVTPGNGVNFQYRTEANAGSDQTTQTGITAPQWVRLTRSGNTFTGEYSANGSNWATLGSVDIAMLADVYIGLCLTSHNVDATCTAEFSNVSTSTSVTGNWQSQDIGIESNIPEGLYVVLQDSAGNSVVVKHPDPAATTIGTWTEWNIPLTEFTGVNLQAITKMSIGVGDRANTQPGSAGDLYIDDIGLELP